jgi:hypothetical protein
MNTAIYVCALTAAGFSLTGCAGKTTNPGLLEARYLFSQLQVKHESYWFAALEKKEAFCALSEADLLYNTDPDSPRIDELSIIAKQKILLAEQLIENHKTGGYAQ